MTDGILLAELQHDRMLRALRHLDHRRGPRAQPEHRLPPRLPQAAAAAASGPQGGHHLARRSTRSGSPSTSRTRGAAGTDHRGLRPHLPGRGALPAAARGVVRRRGGRARPPRPDRGDRGRGRRAARRHRRRHPGVPARASGRSATPPTCSSARRRARGASTSSRCSRGSPPPSSTGSSSGTPGGGSCSPPTSPRPR